MFIDDHIIENLVGSKPRDIRRVHGGDINEAFCVETDDSKFFLKRNSSKLYPRMLEKEARGLKALESSGLKIPAVILQKNSGDAQYLLLEWLTPGRNDQSAWEKLGQGMAALHKQTGEFFGWQEDNYIGRLAQCNDKMEDWPGFYRENRILPLVDSLYRAGKMDAGDLENAEKLCDTAGSLFPLEQPSLLHGDLWSGNYMFSAHGPAIFDPAVYYGHREMDLGMSLLFGGFDVRFYEAYEETYPLSPGWRSRIHYVQLYPLLVHAILFGGGYIQRCREILKVGK